MIEEHNSVQLQGAHCINLAADSGYRWAPIGPNHKNAESVATYLSLDYDRLMAAHDIFRIVDLEGKLIKDDAWIRANARRRR